MQRLVIADGTEHRIVVLDVRAQEQWADPTWDASQSPHAQIYVHHTAARYTGIRRSDELAYLRRIRDVAPFGLPYNFVVFHRWPYRVWYLNDVDTAYPHTYGHNDDTAVCLAGNWQIDVPPAGAVRQVGRVIDALRSMWGNPAMPVLGHRDVYPTACPGDNLYPALSEL